MNRYLKNIVLFLLLLPSLAFAGVRKDNQQVRLFEAVEYILDNDLGSAHKAIKNILKKSPDNPVANYYMGRIRMAMANYPGAESSYKAAIAADSSNFWYKYSLAELYMISQREELAIGILEDLAEDYRSSEKIYSTLVNLYMSQNYPEKALGALDKIESLVGQNPSTVYMKFSIMKIMGRTGDAVTMLEEFRDATGSSDACVILADHYASVYNDTLALQCYEEALAIDRTNARALLGAADMKLYMGDYDGFFHDVNIFLMSPEQPARLKADYMSNMLSMINHNFVARFRPQLDSLYANMIEASPSDTSVMNVSGTYYYAVADYDKADECFRKNIAIAPDSESAWLSYNSLLRAMARWTELESVSNEAILKFGETPAFLEMNAVGAFMNGNMDSALQRCRSLLHKVDGDSLVMANTYIMMAEIYYLDNDLDNCFKCYDKVIEYDNDNYPALNNYAYFLSLDNKKLKDAYRMSKLCIEAEPDNPTYLDTHGWVLYLMGRFEESKAIFKHAMLYGGRDSAVILDHYADVLFALKDYDMAMYYWNLAKIKNDTSDESEKIENLDQKIEGRKSEIKKMF